MSDRAPILPDHFAEREMPFDTFSFSDLPWNLSSANGHDRIKRASAPVTIDGNPYLVSASNRVFLEPNGERSVFFFGLSRNSGERPGVMLTVTLSRSEGGSFVKATSDISRSDEGARSLPRGIGVELFGKGLQFLADTAASGMPIVHQVTAAPYDNDLDKWLRRFGPVLDEHGYVRTGPASWEKKYKTEKEAVA